MQQPNKHTVSKRCIINISNGNYRLVFVEIESECYDRSHPRLGRIVFAFSKRSMRKVFYVLWMEENRLEIIERQCSRLIKGGCV